MNKKFTFKENRILFAMSSSPEHQDMPEQQPEQRELTLQDVDSARQENVNQLKKEFNKLKTIYKENVEERPKLEGLRDSMKEAVKVMDELVASLDTNSTQVDLINTWSQVNDAMYNVTDAIDDYHRQRIGGPEVSDEINSLAMDDQERSKYEYTDPETGVTYDSAADAILGEVTQVNLDVPEEPEEDIQPVEDVIEGDTMVTKGELLPDEPEDDKDVVKGKEFTEEELAELEPRIASDELYGTMIDIEKANEAKAKQAERTAAIEDKDKEQEA